MVDMSGLDSQVDISRGKNSLVLKTIKGLRTIF